VKNLFAAVLIAGVLAPVVGGSVTGAATAAPVTSAQPAPVGLISNATGYCLAAIDGRAYLVPCTLYNVNLDYWRDPPRTGHRVETATGLCLTRSRSHKLYARPCTGRTSQRWIWTAGVGQPGTIRSPLRMVRHCDRGRCASDAPMRWQRRAGLAMACPAVTS